MPSKNIWRQKRMFGCLVKLHLLYDWSGRSSAKYRPDPFHVRAQILKGFLWTEEFILGQLKQAGSKAVKNTVNLRRSQDTLHDQAVVLQEKLANLTLAKYEVAEDEAELEKSLARKYNALCAKVIEAIQKKQAPQNALAPCPILMKDLFNLNVDNEIWQNGILVQDRCDKELERLRYEQRALRQWMSEEWRVVEYMMGSVAQGPGNKGVHFQLEEHQWELTCLCVMWDQALAVLPPDPSLAPWGPSEEALLKQKAELYSENLGDLADKETMDEEEEVNEVDAGILKCLDALQIDTVDEIDMDM
ncbi:hypothetical protein GYMLUDRAFT_250357 [Collybiopsis luxurians FD-317 M1]|uniref:Uncharacterized protein n=1 Tax=Collybiopsis luxurians FD-317 M1 TaxID=944289 RepID=A0A0D0BVA9_9AGAR|nr:hypothetical protein GYMLUDRAFT_250357 [Collybiopsis luxurians FD-317 M1]